MSQIRRVSPGRSRTNSPSLVRDPRWFAALVAVCALAAAAVYMVGQYVQTGCGDLLPTESVTTFQFENKDPPWLLLVAMVVAIAVIGKLLGRRAKDIAIGVALGTGGAALINFILVFIRFPADRCDA